MIDKDLKYLGGAFEELEGDERIEFNGGGVGVSVAVSVSISTLMNPPSGIPGPAPSGCTSRPISPSPQPPSCGIRP